MATLQHSHHLNLTNPNSQFSLYPLKPPTNSTTNTRRAKTLKVLSKKPTNDEEAWKEKKIASVDYDKGDHRVSIHLSGLRKDDLPKRYRLRIEGDRFQKDWAISDVVQQILKLKHWEDIDGVLNRWAGRFARKNFPLLIRVSLYLISYFYRFRLSTSFPQCELLNIINNPCLLKLFFIRSRRISTVTRSYF